MSERQASAAQEQRGLLKLTAAGSCPERSPASASLRAPPEVERGACSLPARRGSSGGGRAPVGRLRVVHSQARVQLGVADLHGAHCLEQAEALAVQQLAQLRTACQAESQPLASVTHTRNWQHTFCRATSIHRRAHIETYMTI